VTGAWKPGAVVVSEFTDEPAKPRMAKEAPSKQKRHARRARPVKVPDSEAEFLFITIVVLFLEIETQARNGRI
jgi:hypothetical protein